MSGNLQVNSGRIEILNSSSIESWDATLAVLNADTIKPRDNVVTFSFAKTGKTVELAKSGISNDDFISILREKIRLIVDAEDPLYERAVARMVTNDPN